MIRAQTKVLILYTSVGHGIKITAKNIYDQLSKHPDFEPRDEDLYQVAPGRIVKILERLYFRLTETFPFIWGWLYSDTVASITIPFRLLAASFRYNKILSLIREFGPQIVVSTETVPSGIVAYLKRKKWYQGRLVIVFSDYHLHRFWLYDEADLYLCVTAEQVSALQALGIPREKIALTGMIVAEKYLQKIPRREAAATFGLDPQIPAVLISGGRRGLLASIEIVRSLLKSNQVFQIIVVTGLNDDLKHNLQSLPESARHKLHILGYISNQDTLMSAVDIIISKPGGPTIAEAAAKGLPVIITDAHPGHETKNLEFLSRHNIAYHAPNPPAVKTLVEGLLAGRLYFDPAAANAAIIHPEQAVSVTTALSGLHISKDGTNINT